MLSFLWLAVLMRTNTFAIRQKNKEKKSLPLPIMLLLSLLAGLSFVLSLAPYGYWWVAILSPMALYALLLPKSVRSGRGFLIGWAYGFGLWATGAFWLYHAIHVYGHIPSAMAYGLIGLMALIMGLFSAVMAWGFVRFLGRQPLAFAAIWVLFEWLRTWLFTGFPWLFVGYAYTELPFVVSLAPVAGVFAISFISVLLSAGLVEIVRQKAGYAFLAGLAVLAGVGLWLADVKWTAPTGQALSVSLVQGNIDQDIKWQASAQGEILETYAKLSHSHWGQDLVVWPEAAVPMFADEAADFLGQMRRFAQMTGSTLLTGIPYRDLEGFNPQTDAHPEFYNAVMTFGASEGLYKKQRLVPFGEYTPLAGALDILPNLASNQSVIGHSKGAPNQPVIAIGGHPMGLAICYEVAYPDVVRKNAQNREFLLTVSNDAWFGTSAGPHQHLQMVRMRSLELGKWFVRGTNNGITAIIDEKGRIVDSLPQFTPAVLRGQVSMMAGQTPYAKYGDAPILSGVAVLLLLSAWAGRNQRYFSKDGRFSQDYR